MLPHARRPAFSRMLAGEGDLSEGPAVNGQWIGAAGGIRTPDPRITNAMLYRLSYCGIGPIERRKGRRQGGSLPVLKANVGAMQGAGKGRA